jgi:exodeoxyribonuclease VII small subunit
LYLIQIYVTFFQAKKGVMSVTNKPNALPSLEESLTEVSQLIEKMEHSELTLEQSLTNFEKGITLIKHCQKVLTEAEQKVQILIQNNKQDELGDYNDGNNDSHE